MDDFNATDSENVDGVVRQVVVDGVGECFALGRVEFFKFQIGCWRIGCRERFQFCLCIVFDIFCRLLGRLSIRIYSVCVW